MTARAGREKPQASSFLSTVADGRPKIERWHLYDVIASIFKSRPVVWPPSEDKKRTEMDVDVGLAIMPNRLSMYCRLVRRERRKKEKRRELGTLAFKRGTSQVRPTELAVFVERKNGGGTTCNSSLFPQRRPCVKRTSHLVNTPLKSWFSFRFLSFFFSFFFLSSYLSLWSSSPTTFKIDQTFNIRCLFLFFFFFFFSFFMQHRFPNV